MTKKANQVDIRFFPVKTYQKPLTMERKASMS